MSERLISVFSRVTIDGQEMAKPVPGGTLMAMGLLCASAAVVFGGAKVYSALDSVSRDTVTFGADCPAGMKLIDVTSTIDHKSAAGDFLDVSCSDGRTTVYPKNLAVIDSTTVMPSTYSSSSANHRSISITYDQQNPWLHGTFAWFDGEEKISTTTDAYSPDQQQPAISIPSADISSIQRIVDVSFN